MSRETGNEWGNVGWDEMGVLGLDRMGWDRMRWDGMAVKTGEEDASRIQNFKDNPGRERERGRRDKHGGTRQMRK